MSDGQHLRGADPVNDELEVGFDDKFERRWARAEIAGRVVMAIVVGAALLGLLGRGPFSHRVHKAPDGLLAVDYEPVARSGTSTQVTLHLRAVPDEANGNAVTVFVGDELVEPMGLQLVLPEPSTTELRPGGTEYTFGVQPAASDALVRFELKPSTVGLVRLQARRTGGSTVDWTQLVLP